MAEENAVVKTVKGAFTWPKMVGFLVLLVVLFPLVMLALDFFGVGAWVLQPWTSYKLWVARKNAAAPAPAG